MMTREEFAEFWMLDVDFEFVVRELNEGCPTEEAFRMTGFEIVERYADATDVSGFVVSEPDMDDSFTFLLDEDHWVIQ